MKIAFLLVIIVMTVLACGCTASAPSQPLTPATLPAAATPVTPDLTGTWTGTSTGYAEGTGFTDYGNAPLTMTVTEQKGRIFSGTVKVGKNSTETIAIAGVISRDGRTFALVENVNGYTTGEITGPGTIELTHVDDGDPYEVALDTLKRG